MSEHSPEHVDNPAVVDEDAPDAFEPHADVDPEPQPNPDADEDLSTLPEGEDVEEAQDEE